MSSFFRSRSCLEHKKSAAGRGESNCECQQREMNSRTEIRNSYGNEMSVKKKKFHEVMRLAPKQMP